MCICSSAVGSSLRGVYYGPWDRDLGEIFEFLVGAGETWFTKERHLPKLNHTVTLVHTHARYLALRPRFEVYFGPQQRLLRLPGVAIWADFRGSGRVGDVLVIYTSYQVEATTKIKLYPHLVLYPCKVFSASTEVWRIPWPSTAPITAPGGRDLG